jgi:hypothetical protein
MNRQMARQIRPRAAPGRVRFAQCEPETERVEREERPPCPGQVYVSSLITQCNDTKGERADVQLLLRKKIEF